MPPTIEARLRAWKSIIRCSADRAGILSVKVISPCYSCMNMPSMHVSPITEPWRELAEPGIKGSVYLACWLPRSQTEVIRWIYGTKPATNIRPVIEARRYLQKHGYLKVEDETRDLRRIKLISQPAPFLPYALDKLKRVRPRKGASILSHDELEVLRRVLDSVWFRKSFNERLEDWRKMGMANVSLQTVGEFVEEVSTINTVFAKAFAGILPTTREILASKTFDNFIELWFNTKLKTRPRLVKIARRTALGLLNRIPGEIVLTKNTLDHPALPPLCMPLELADKLSRVGRIQLTLLENLFEALEDAFEFEKHGQEVEFQKLATSALSQDIGKFLFNGISSKTIPYASYATPEIPDESSISENASVVFSVSWESPSEGIASTLFNDFLSLSNDTREGVSKLVLWAFWTGIREKIEVFLSEMIPGETMNEAISKNKLFLEKEVLPTARSRNDTAYIRSEEALLEILSLTEQSIAKTSLAQFLDFTLGIKGKVDDLMRIVLNHHGNYPASGELLFGELTQEFGERMFGGLVAVGERERVQSLLPRHILEALGVWNGFVSRMLSSYDDDPGFQEIRGRLEASKDNLRNYLEFLPSLADLMKKRKIAIAYLWAS